MMKTRLLIPCLVSTLSITACSTGNNVANVPHAISPSLQRVSGTLSIALDAPASSASGSARHRQFVSAGTKHAALFINGQSAASGSTTSCTATTGTGSGCTISWTASLPVPASYVFAVEIDSGASGTPANTVLAEGSGTYAIVSGTNTLAPALSLNGVVANASFTVGSCGGTLPSTQCTGTVTLSDATKNAIGYSGALTAPATGNSPTSGNVFDNGQVTLTSSAPSVGTVSGTAQSSYSSFASNTLTIAGVDSNGAYTYAVTCGAATIGSFGITLGGAASPSGAVSTSELSSLSPAVSYPAAGVATVPTAPSFTCAAGLILDATGSLGVN